MTKRAKAPADTLPVVRCAIYTRKSSEEGLEQEFNSLDAQREAGEAYVRSQQGVGWACLADRYDDGGFTGGNTDRPGLRRLLHDIQAGRVDCVVVYKVDRLNRTAAIATWDDGKLVAELLALQGMDVDLGSTGFTADELADLLKDDAPELAGDPDAVPDPPADPVTRPGDLWLLGRHRLLCGDATNPADLARVLDGVPADLLLTDPPYNVAYEGKTAEKLTIANDAMAGDDYRRFLARSLVAAKGVLRPGAAFYLWHADLEGLNVRAACGDAGLQVRQCLIWVKSAFSLGRFDYHWKHEPCLYGWADGAAHTWLSDRAQTTVLAFDRPAKNDVHPTMKPVDLFAYLVGNSCPEGGVVLDPFAGSGTALVAAEHTGRTAALVELDPRYCDVIARRYEDLTGTPAERVPAGDALPATV